jgi:beta-N-acetylhexosaminidase
MHASLVVMIRNPIAAIVVLGCMPAFLALTSHVADARPYRSHVASKHAKHWGAHRHRATARRAHRKATKKSTPKTAIPTVKLGMPLPPKRPLKVLTRDEILASNPDRLARLGRHIVVGFGSFDELKPLVEKQAIAGIFVTDRNVRGRKAADVAKDIQTLQDIRKSQGLPRLLVAADQEGGYVSRLSPPLKRQPALSSLVHKRKTDAELEKAVRDYADTQAHELERIGVTMNFGPVVDLRPSSPRRDDGETRLYWRAIDSDPYVVAKVAGWYCDTLTKFNIICTLKHFPGLGRVAHDTHVTTGEISATQTQLELSDWVPFRRLMGKPGIATMVGHVRIKDVDKTTPASYSDTVINTVLRGRTKGDVLLITDDLGMGAVMRSPDGIGGVAIKALNAGVDLLLLSDVTEYYNPVMSALIEADTDHEINQARQIESRERMSKYVFVDDSTPPPAQPLQAQKEPRQAPPPAN